MTNVVLLVLLTSAEDKQVGEINSFSCFYEVYKVQMQKRKLRVSNSRIEAVSGDRG